MTGSLIASMIFATVMMMVTTARPCAQMCGVLQQVQQDERRHRGEHEVLPEPGGDDRRCSACAARSSGASGARCVVIVRSPAGWS